MSSTTSTAKDAARDALSEARKATSAAGDDIQSDLEALRKDIAKLASQLGDIVSSQGTRVWKGVVGDASAKGQEAVDAVREVSDNLVGAIDESLEKRPYTTLAIAFGVGFLLGITRR
jgi:ElaB/YqjD/DUF883 family membrane-anchored ribosome-binding protein